MEYIEAVSQKHTQFEFVLRRNVMSMASDERMVHLITNLKGSRLRYKDLIA